MRLDAIPQVIVTDRDSTLMNAVKTMFLETTNLLCWFHIDKNVKAKCKMLMDQKSAWGLYDGSMRESCGLSY